MTDAAALYIWLALIVLLSLICFGIWISHRITKRKLDDIENETTGIRIRLERHAEEVTDAIKSDMSAWKRLRLSAFQSVKEALEFIVGKEK